MSIKITVGKRMVSARKLLKEQMESSQDEKLLVSVESVAEVVKHLLSDQNTEPGVKKSYESGEHSLSAVIHIAIKHFADAVQSLSADKNFVGRVAEEVKKTVKDTGVSPSTPRKPDAAPLAPETNAEMVARDQEEKRKKEQEDYLRKRAAEKEKMEKRRQQK